MSKQRLTMVGAFVLATVGGGTALALENPLVVDLHATQGAQREASATLFGSGSSVLVNITAQGSIPKTAAVSLNSGSCSKPGDIAFALTSFEDNQSLTKLDHPLTDVAGKAKSMVIHQTSNLRSPAFACGKVSD